MVEVLGRAASDMGPRWAHTLQYKLSYRPDSTWYGSSPAEIDHAADRSVQPPMWTAHHECSQLGNDTH